MHTSRMKVAILAALTLTLGVVRVDAAEAARFFPETGKGAIHQRSLDLSCGATVLVVALQPGYEDLPLLAYLRTAIGARVAVTFLGNGEATPSDTGGRTPMEVAAQRKVEAVSVARALGESVHFLNLPDLGVTRSHALLEDTWNVDTVRARLQRDLLYYRPDVVIIEGDMRGDSVRSMRAQMTVDFVEKAIQSAGNQGQTSRSAIQPPRIATRVYVETEPSARGFRVPAYDLLHPAWNITYRSIALDAAHEYQSLRIQLPFWMRRGDRQYGLVHSRKAVPTQNILAGVPGSGIPIRSLDAFIRKTVGRSSGNIRTPLLRDVIQAIDSVDVRLARGRGSLDERDFRLLVAWKNGLEGLRCSLLDIDITYTSSDSLLAERQLFYLNFQWRASGFSEGKTTIYFPGAIDHIWGVNESLGHQFAFQPPQQFRILTPEHIDYSFPLTEFGIGQTTLGTRCPFIVVHDDTVPGNRFVYRGEVTFLAAPKRTFEILTPEVRAINGAAVICKLVDISRDQFHGTITMSDSLVNTESKGVVLRGKDDTVVDTLRLSLKGPLPPGDYPISVSLPGDVKAQFVARSFDVRADTGSHVALMTAINESPVAHALDCLGIRWDRVPTSQGSVPELSAATVVILDRDALADIGHQRAVVEAINAYVRKGGHLIVFPQSHASNGGNGLIPGVAFRGSPLLPPGAPVHVDSAHLFSTPNVIGAKDWEGWYVARSLCSVKLPADRRTDVVVSSGKDRVPLLVTFMEGKGRVTVVALDLVSQFMRLHPGAYRLFANLIRKSEL